MLRTMKTMTMRKETTWPERAGRGACLVFRVLQVLREHLGVRLGDFGLARVHAQRLLRQPTVAGRRVVHHVPEVATRRSLDGARVRVCVCACECARA